MDGQENKRIAVVTLQVNAYSETFIQAQISQLPADLVLHGGLIPTMAGIRPVLSPFKKAVNAFFQKLFHRDLFLLETSIATLLRKEKIGVVLAQYGPGGVAILPVCKKAGIPLVVHFHGYDASHTATLKKYGHAYKALFAYAKSVVVVSRSMFDRIKSIGCPEEKLVLNPYGVNELFFRAAPALESELFFAMGRFVEKKAPDLTIRAFARVVKQFPSAKLYMAGQGPLMENCKDLVNELGLGQHIFFPGILQPEMVFGFMQKSLAFVQHSVVAPSGDSEGAPVAIMEASAAALPVISTFHAGIPEIVQDGITGILVKERDIDQMAEAMITLLADKDLARRMGEEGRKKALIEFTQDRYLSVLRNLLQS